MAVESQTLQLLLSLVLFALGLFSLFLLTQSKGNRTANLILGGMMFTWFLSLLDSLGLLTGWMIEHNRFAFWGGPLVWLMGPWVYFYTQSVLFPDFRFRRRDLLHLLPFLVMIISSQVGFQRLEESFRRQIVTDALYYRGEWLGVIMVLIYFQYLLYWGRSVRALNRYRERMRENFSNEDRINLPWLQFFLWGTLGIQVMGLVQTLVRFSGGSDGIYEVTLALTGIFLLVFFSILILKALRQPEIFSGLVIEPSSAITPLQANDLEALSPIAARLKTHMEQAQPFLQPDLSLKQLAEQLALSPRLVSQTLNRVFEQNFFDFVNHHRILLAQEKIRSATDPKTTVLEIMYEVGFQSKSSFNTAFKKFTGLTPTQFRKAEH